MDHVVGFRCEVCGATVDVSTPFPWRCPNATGTDRHHVLSILSAGPMPDAVDDPDPFVAYGPRLAWWAFARNHGMTAEACTALTREIGGDVAHVAGTRFVRTPFARADHLSDALGFSRQGGIWVKDETRHVAESHKARHLMTVLLHLVAAERLGLAPWTAPDTRPPLAIASCGNAAIAASVLADAVGWPIRVFVPPWASPAVITRLERHHADVVVCPRLDSDPPGDPCIHRFREAVDAGAVPFGVQGPENALALDGGRTLGWDLVDSAVALDRVVIQVGGGAFASCVGSALAASASPPRLHAVQAAGCAPLARAWVRAGALPQGRAAAAANWDECMWPWDEGEPTSVADGILDDETYDWLGVMSAMEATHGGPVVATEELVVEAHRLARTTTSIPVSATGSAGLAGVLALRGAGHDGIRDDERVAIVFSGAQR